MGKQDKPIDYGASVQINNRTWVSGAFNVVMHPNTYANLRHEYKSDWLRDMEVDIQMRIKSLKENKNV